MFSWHDESVYAIRALRAGANGYVMKDEPTNHCVTALRLVARGDLAVSFDLSGRLLRRSMGLADENVGPSLDSLSDCELVIFELIGKGAETREIASCLQRSVSTVQGCRTSIEHKLRFKDYAELLCRAVRWMEHGKGCTA